ncbi:A-kinase anchor protein 14 isoform X2 [Lepidochelys kempii]|uniref:A-kinase anchor protein 14 isoform X2 n=1 Tax=Lepidochelys kempii TaxID=8472 RepID=UPI003C6F48CF
MITLDILEHMSGQPDQQGLPLPRGTLMIMGVGDEDAVIKEKAQILIEDVIRDAKEHLRDLQEKEREAEYIIQNIQWTSCKDFTVERGQQQIEEYMSRLSSLTNVHGGGALLAHDGIYHIGGCAVICTREWKTYSVVYVQQTWEFHGSWLHWSDYLQEQELTYSKRYHYRVRWSIPTCRKPIPRTTACIYFIIEISKIKPPTLPVEVFFILESNRFIHRPGQCRFREKWLKDIIESKKILMDSITF